MWNNIFPVRQPKRVHAVPWYKYNHMQQHLALNPHTHTHSSGSNSSTLSLILFIYFYSRKTADIALRCITSREEEERSCWGASFRPPSYKSLSSAPIESSRNKETGRPYVYMLDSFTGVSNWSQSLGFSLFFSSLFLLIFRRKKKNVSPRSSSNLQSNLLLFFPPLSNIIIVPNRFESRWNYAEYFFFMFLFQLVVRGSAIKIDCGDVPAKKGDDDSRVIDSSLFFSPSTQQLCKAKISFSPFWLSPVETQTQKERKEI